MDVTLVRSARSKMAALSPLGRRVSRPAPRFSPGDYTLEEEVTPVRRGVRRRGPLLVGGVIETPNRGGGQRRGRGRGRYQPVVELGGGGEESENRGREEEDVDDENNNEVSEGEESNSDSDRDTREGGEEIEDEEEHVEGGAAEQGVPDALPPAPAAEDGEEEEEEEDEEMAAMGDVAARLNPVVPGPRVQVQEEVRGDGWADIDRLGAWDCQLSIFNSMEDVPLQFEAGWSMAFATVLEREAGAQTDLQRERALKWFCFLPQALLRAGAGGKRGGRAGKQAVQQRFTALAQGSWGRLVELWERDMRSARKKEERPERMQTRNQKKEQEEQSLRRKAIMLISSGQVGKAESRMNSHGIASMSDPLVREQMARKYPTRVRELPDEVPLGQAVPHLRGLREELKGLGRRRAPGSGGLRAEFLKVLGESLEAQQMALLEDWGMRTHPGRSPSLVLQGLAECRDRASL